MDSRKRENERASFVCLERSESRLKGRRQCLLHYDKKVPTLHQYKIQMLVRLGGGKWVSRVWLKIIKDNGDDTNTHRCLRN